MGIQVKLSPSGRISIPADVRKRLGLKPGATLTLLESEFGITLSTFQQRVAKAQALYRQFSEGKPTISVDEFIAERRADAAREEAEFDHP